MLGPVTTGSGRDSAKSPRLRADAARNRERVLAAAREAFRESGTAAAMDEIARRAGVNIATLYRRFPDRDALIQQVTLDGFTLVLQAARDARDSGDDSLTAVEAFLLELVDQRELLVLPLIGGPAIDTPEAVDLQQQIAATLEELLAAGRQHGSIREDVTAVDLITTGALACRPLPHLPTDQATALAIRHVRVFTDGMQPAAARPLPAAVPHDEVAGHMRTPTADRTARSAGT